MKTMMMTDLITSKKYIVSQTVLSLVVALFMALVMGNLYVVIPVVACMVPFSLVFSLMAFDERNGWERFRLTLPLSRNQVVTGRYMSALVLTVGSGLLACLLFIICVPVLNGLSGIIALNQDLVYQLNNLDGQTLFAVFSAPIGMTLLLFGITLPFAARFGLTKSIRLIPLSLFVVVMLGMTAFQATGASVPPFVVDSIAWLVTPEGTVTAVAVALTAIFALYGFSCLIATKVYAKREL